MLEIESKRYIFKTKTIWFSDAPFDVSGYDGVSFHACTEDVDLEGFSKQEFTTLVIDLTQELDTIWKDMSKSSCRYSINKAKKEGVTVRVNQNYKEFYSINSEFRKEKGLSKFDVDIEFMKRNGILFISEYQGKIMGGQFYLCDGNSIRWLLGASKRLEETGHMRTLIGNANRLMIWQAINYAKDNKISNFDLGGYYTGEIPDSQKHSINVFKKSFGGELVTHYIYQKDYSRVYSLAKWAYNQYKGL